MRVLFSIVAIAALAAAAPDKSEPRCNSLRTACTDFFLAVECGTLDECISRWERLDTPVGNDTELCATCKKMVQEARDNLMSNLTQSELREVLEGSCDTLIPIPPFNGMCKKLMDAFQDELNDMLVSRMDPTQVCTVSGLCWKPDDSDIEQRASDLFLRKSAAKTCSTCKSNVEKLVGITQFVEKGDMVRAFSNACQNAGFVKSKCDAFAHTYVAKFLHHFHAVPSEKTCQFFGRCDGLSRPMPLGVGDDLECEFCEAMIHKVVSQFNNTSMKEQVKTVLQNICKKTGSWATECQQRIDNDFDQAYDELISMLDPVNVCNLAGICSSKQSLRTLPMLKLTPAKPAAPGSSVMCSVCTDVAGAVEKAVNANFTQNQLINALDLVCDILPVVSRQNCFDFVSKNLPQLIKMFNERFTVEYICSESFNFCPAASEAVKPVSGPVCDECLKIANVIVAAINDDRTEQNIKDALDKTCELCPDYANCRQFIDDNVEQLIQILREKVTADEICRTLRLCGARVAVPKKTEKIVEGGCGLCSTIIDFLIKELKGNTTDAAVLAAFEKVCNVLPVDKQQCRNYIDVYGEYIISLIEQNVAADIICASIGLCRSPKPAIRDPKTICNECEQIAGYLVDAVNDDKSEENIKAVVEKACEVIPMDVAKCQEFVDTNIDQLYDLLRQEVTVDKICQSLRLCAPRTAPGKPRIVKKSCGLCSEVVNYLMGELKNNRTDAAILDALERVCKVLPFDKSECQNVINVYGEYIISMLQQDVAADVICRTIGLCGTALSKPVKGQECELCETVATFLVDELKDNKTDEAILEALERVCSVLPVDKVSCRNAIETYGGIIMSMIQQDATADEICAAIGLCSARRIEKNLKDDKCNACKAITGFLVDELKDNQTDAAVVVALEKVCRILPIDRVQCQNYVDVYGNMVIEMIKNNVSADEICSSIGFCASKMQLFDNQSCPFCEIAVHVVEAELQNNNTQKEIEAALEKACSLTPQKDRAQCRNMVNVYTAYIIEMVESLATAEQICQTLGFCPTPPTPPTCEVCLYVTNLVESQLSDNRTETDIQQLLDKACNYIPNVDVPQCKETINQASDMIITLLLQTVPPRKICEEIKMCPLFKKDVVPAPKPRDPTPEQCTFCKWLVTWVDDKLQDNRTEAVIIDELDKACDLLTDAGKCRDMVNDYINMIVEMLVAYAEPEKICEAIKKCPIKQQPSRDEPPCRYCRYVIDELRGDVQKTEAELKQKLDGICRVIPVDQTDCQSFVNQYADQIIQLILSDTDPEKICEILGVCPKKIKATNTKCNFCRELMQFVTSEVQDETTDDDIVGFVSEACNYVPAIHREDCQRLVEIEGLVIVRMIAESLDADSICAAIKYCPEKRNTDKLTCTWCQYALHFLQEKLYDNSTQQAIREELDKMCSELPQPSLSAECKEFVDTYGPSLEVIIAQDLDPSVICPAIHACPARRSAAKPGRRTSSQKCHNCVSSLKSFRHNPTQICEGVNTQYAEKCVTASFTGLRLVNAFESDYKICKLAKACSKLSGSFRCNRGGCQFVR